jgi:radical SAM family uncharacterized protein
MEIDSELLEKILINVEKPIRYVGGEWNAVRKSHEDVDVSVLLAFPDTYEIGMSHLGLRILYHILNEREDVVCERTFMPWVDMYGVMMDSRIPLYALESRVPAREFDILGFSLQYELSYTNVLAMLDLAGIPLLSAERGEDEPLIIAGGPSVYNPEPIADFIDAILIGEGEEAIEEIVDVYREAKANCLCRKELLQTLAQIPGVYVPSFYRVSYFSDGKVKEITPVNPAASYPIKKRVVKDLSQVKYPDRFVTPFTEIVHDRAVLEVFRGCTRGCRFCQAGMVYRPVRERPPNELLQLAETILKNTGYDEISLMSLSSADYSHIREVCADLINTYKETGVAVSLPSLRVDSFSVDLAKEVQKVRKTGLTFAPEAGTERLRNIINKGVTEDDLIRAATSAFSEGWHRLKLYFMIGLPSETEEDLKGIVDMAKGTLACGRRELSRAGIKKAPEVTVSVASFVPKAHTPFQWQAQMPREELVARQAYLKKHLRGRGLKFTWHDVDTSFIEAVLSRGSRRLGKVVETAYRLGCKFDAWDSEFHFGKWMQAFELAEIPPELYGNTKWEYSDILPWEHISAGVSKEFLMQEAERALSGTATPDCRSDGCSNCGVCTSLEVAPKVISAARREVVE